MDTSENAVYREFFAEPLDIRGGRVTVPDRPDLGVEITDLALRHIVR